MMYVKVSKDKHISRWVDGEERTSSMLNEIESNPCIQNKKVINRGKRSKTLSDVKPFKNVSKNLQSFLEINLVQKEVLISHKL